jgi:hypothetical protein
VVEDDVENAVDALFVRRVDQIAQIFARAE